MDIEGTVAVMTGGASGIGRATALELARNGAAAIVIADINNERAAAVVDEVEALGPRALQVVDCNVGSDDDIDVLESEAIDAFGHVDIVFNNAGVPLLGPPERISMEDWDYILQINLYGVIRGVRAFVPAMIERGSGYVVNTASIAGLLAYSWDAIPYITSKFGVYGFTEGLSLYLRPQGIGVSVVCPGLVETNLGENAHLVGVPAGVSWTAGMDDFRPISADEVATQVVDAIRTDRFLVLTHPEFAEVLAERGRDLEAAVAARMAGLPDPPRLS